ncbi:MAG: hypothetical protein CME62_14910 [Halobacteriovoraceae bacterium]|nr:hypothetical protein [Halobacteriovoraceae bacterium]|tara:strand:- start:3722 stop:3916 length:195 start_codon:yes stop_codon:yes gene_type:complete
MTTLKIKDLHCNSCVANINEGILKVDQDAKVKGDIKNSEIMIKSELNESQLREIISNVGYEVLN